MAKFVESRRTWDKGDWGNLGSYRAGQAEDGLFKAENMQVYDNGSIGPRAGVVAMGYTGLPVGAVQAWGYVPAVKGGFTGLLLAVVGNTAYWAPALSTGEAWTAIGTLAGTETQFCSALPIMSEGMCYFATRTQGVYKWNVSTDTLTQVFSQSGIYDLERYRDRLYVATTRRIFYSDAADFDTWDAALQFFDVGWHFANYRLASLRNNLFVITQSGHHVVSGVPESTLTLREAGAGLSPDEHSAVKRPAQDSVWWIPQNRNGPVKFRGGIIDTKELEYLEDWTTSISGARSAAYSFGSETTLFVGADNGGLVHYNDVWTKHAFAVDVKYTTRVASDWFALTDGGDASTAATFWLWGYNFEQPGITEAGQGRRPGDASDTPVAAYVHLPEWWHPQGQDVRVESVEVEFVSFDTGTAETAHFDLVVRAMRPKAVGDAPATSYTDAATVSFDEATASSSADGTERRVVFHVGGQGWGRGYQIRFSNVRNVAIRSVSLTAQTEQRSGR